MEKLNPRFAREGDLYGDGTLEIVHVYNEDCVAVFICVIQVPIAERVLELTGGAVDLSEQTNLAGQWTKIVVVPVEVECGR